VWLRPLNDTWVGSGWLKNERMADRIANSFDPCSFRLSSAHLSASSIDRIGNTILEGLVPGQPYNSVAYTSWQPYAVTIAISANLSIGRHSSKMFNVSAGRGQRDKSGTLKVDQLTHLRSISSRRLIIRVWAVLEARRSWP
jgi:hypothetical protein